MKEKKLWHLTVDEIDPETGEILKSYETRAKATGCVIFTSRRKIPRNINWAMLFLDNFKKLAKDKTLRGTDWRVFAFLISETSWKNWIQVPQRAIAENLGLSQSKVSESIKRLSEKGIIQVVRDGRSNRYRINPDFLWRGEYGEKEKVVELPSAKNRPLYLVDDES